MSEPLTPTEEQTLAELLNRKQSECAQAILSALGNVETLIVNLETILAACTDSTVIDRIGRLLLMLRADGRSLVAGANATLTPPEGDAAPEE